MNYEQTLLEHVADMIGESGAQKAEVVTGSYKGTGATSNTINLGFRPRALLVMTNYGFSRDSNSCYGGLVLDGLPVLTTYGNNPACITITAVGFQLTSQTYAQVNSEYYTYYFMAIK